MKPKSICLLLLLVNICYATAQRRSQLFEDYILKYKKFALQQMDRHRIPASITLAQGLLESGAGTSTLAKETNNHFGIKKGANWNGPVYEHPDDSQHDLFRVYDNVGQSYEDHSAILLKPRYQKLFNLDILDYKGWARGLKECGYATSPTYAERLINIVETYELFKIDREYLANNNFDDNYILNEHNPGYNNNPGFLNNNNHNNRVNTHNQFRKFTENNGIPCVIALENDNWYSLAEELGIKLKRLLKFNEANVNVKINRGDFIYLAKKAKKGPKYMKHKWHKVATGENMYFIAQFYGIRIHNLYKMNFKSPDYVPRVGDLLKVR